MSQPDYFSDFSSTCTRSIEDSLKKTISNILNKFSDELVTASEGSLTKEAVFDNWNKVANELYTIEATPAKKTKKTTKASTKPKCSHIFTKKPREGEQCKSYATEGESMCKTHLKIAQKKESEAEEKVKEKKEKPKKKPAKKAEPVEELLEESEESEEEEDD
jgi:hypothetical protein